MSSKFYIRHEASGAVWACYARDEADARSWVRRASNCCDWVRITSDRSTLTVVSREEAYQSRAIRETPDLDPSDPLVSAALAEGRLLCGAVAARDYAPSGMRIYPCGNRATTIRRGMALCEHHARRS